MKRHEIENWALNIVDQVKSGQSAEDDKVELKSLWPSDPKKAARRMAGHANAARGEPILWLIGVDERNGVVGADDVEMANWWPTVQAEFAGLTPGIVAHLNILVEDKTIVAILFETDRAPFVVKNPVHGSAGGGSVSLEVPWREGTSIRSARQRRKRKPERFLKETFK
jgi:hypothetical protein